jgi:hypothetical protein
LIHIQPKFYDFPSVLLSNITGALNCKIPEISELGETYDTDIFCIAETWCNENVPDDALRMSNYSFYRRDRADGRAGGGLICYINENIPVIKVWSELDEVHLETLFITIRPKRLPRGVSHVTLGIVYHPPKSDDWVMSQHLIKSFDFIHQKYPQSGFIICGDFNHMKDSYFKNTCQLFQIVKRPTHGKSTIDLVYTNLKDHYESPLHVAGIGLSRHQTIILKPSHKCKQKPQKLIVEKRKISNQNKLKLLGEIEDVNWVELFKANTCDDKFSIFMNILNKLIDKHMPLVRTYTNNNDRPWVTDRFRKLIRCRQFYFSSGNDSLFRFYRNKVNRERKKLKSNFVTTTLANLKKENTKQWWQLIKSITGQNTQNNHMQRLANTSFDGDLQRLANEINNSFQRVSSHLQPLKHINKGEFIIPDEYIISVDQVENRLSKINITKSPGPDGIPSWILRYACRSLAAPVCAIWNSSLRESYIPMVWKSANTVPLPKVSHPSSFDKDLRPISLTPILSKGLEFFTRNWFFNIFKPHIDSFQYGSQQKCSTVIALAQLIHQWLYATETKLPVIRILLLDFKKAFDLVDHNILLDKIKTINTPPFLTSWLSSFLSDRQQRVKVGGALSEWANLNAGVPQGTLLGPALFLLHINDLQTACPSVKYVDDTTLWESCPSDISNSNIQAAANDVMNWCSRNNMQINCDKTKEMVIDFGKKRKIIPEILMGDKVLERVDMTKLLGIIINNKLTWGDHVDYICKKVSKRIYFIRLLKRAGISSHDILQVYYSIIRSVLEYACEIWHPGLNKCQTNQLEYIQKRIIKMIYPNTPYDDAIIEHKIPTLAERRDVTFTKK